VSAGFAAYAQLGVMADNVAALKEDIRLRDVRERNMRDRLIVVEGQAAAAPARCSP